MRLILSKTSFLLLVLWALSGSCLEAQSGVQAGVRVGRILEVLPRFPEITSPGIMLHAGFYQKAAGQRMLWGELMGRPTWSLDLSYESFGNASVLGYGLGLMPSVFFNLKQRPKVKYTMQLGWGLAYLNRPFSKENTENRIIGSHFNLQAILGFHVAFSVSPELSILSGFSISHYSNGGISNPNIGVNIPSLSVILRRETQPDAGHEPAVLPESVRFWSIAPFLRSGLGFQEAGLDGPKFPIYSLAGGAFTRAGKVSLIKLGFEFSRSSKSQAFIEQVGLYPGNEQGKSNRTSIFFSHELLFGYFAFLTEAGMYLSDHHERLSIISTRIGFSFFPRNFLRVNHQVPGIGVYVRAYQGEADYLEFSVFHHF